MDQARPQLPDLDTVLASPADVVGDIVQGALVRTWAQVDGYNSPSGRRLFFVAWRAWFDALELRPFMANDAKIGFACLDVLEHLMEAAREA